MSRTLNEYLSSLQGKTVAVVGIGVSNTPLIRLLLDAGISVTACDKRTAADKDFAETVRELEQLGAKMQLGEGYLEGLSQDVIFRSPGIRPDVPEFTAAQAGGSVLTSEMEVFFEICPCRIIAVTGSDGKTTTTSLIAEMLKNADYTVHVGGNIGRPLLADVPQIKKDDIAVLELSSFQLMTLRQSPQIAVVTNLSPNHLDIHTSMDEYRQAKENIFLYQGGADMLVLNDENEETRDMMKRARAEVFSFRRQGTLTKGVFVEDGTICIAEQGEKRALFSTEEILIPGVHNVENYLAAIAVVKDLVSVSVMRHTAKTFPGVEHRIELVRTLEGVRYYNDSIASSPTRTIAGLRAFPEKVILIAGGYDKKIPFEELGEEICGHVKSVILVGDTAEKIRDSIVNAKAYQEAKPDIMVVDTLAEAVSAAEKQAKSGDVVTLSPACASFDQFPNFAARGKAFKDFVHGL